MQDTNNINWLANPSARQSLSNKTSTEAFSHETTLRVRSFHRAVPGYEMTPLLSLKNLAEYLGVGEILVKDESHRFGLNAFKALGASFALTDILAEKFGMDRAGLSFQQEDIKTKLKEITCVTATDGNHGRAVAWSAQQLGCKAVVFMPGGSSSFRVKNIQAHGADVSVIDGNYDDAVALASENARKNGWLLVQDTAIPGYEDTPLRIMQGYLTILDEVFDQIENEPPTHLFLQCGVGSFPATLQAGMVQRFGKERPVTIIVEPVNADCFYRSIKKNDGNPHRVTGDLDTIMAGLACGQPSELAWNILRDFSDIFISCGDGVTMTGMKVFGNPMGNDSRIVSGESGAVTLGILIRAMRDGKLLEMKRAIGLNRDSRVLLISTEGDTDPEIYRRIVKLEE